MDDGLAAAAIGLAGAVAVVGVAGLAGCGAEIWAKALKVARAVSKRRQENGRVMGEVVLEGGANSGKEIF